MNTLRYALRFLLRARTYTLINLLGLAFSLACCIILLRYIHRELTVDTHCVDREKVYAVQVSVSGGAYWGSYAAYRNDSVLIALELIETKCSFVPLENDFLVSDGHRYRCDALATDSTFFQLFSYPLIQGEKNLTDPSSVVLTQSYAREVFGSDNPVGKTITYSNGQEYVVKGVIGLPVNKTWLNFDMLLANSSSNSWEKMPLDLYRFVPGADMNKLNQVGKHPRRLNPHYPSDTRVYTFRFVPLKECYFSKLEIRDKASIYVWGDWGQLQIFMGICALLLVTGLLNFINLYMIFMLKRTHEYGIRRVFGAGRGAVFAQIFAENFLLSALAVLLAWVCIELTRVPVSRFFGFDFSYTAFDGYLSLALLIFLPLVASLYPYFRFTRILPSVGIRLVSTAGQSVRARMGLLLLQYVLTLILVVLAFYFNRQLDTLLHTDPGYRTENILVAHLAHESKDYSSYQNPEDIQARVQRVKQLGAKMKACPDIEYWVADQSALTSSDFGMKFIGNNGRTAFLYMWYANPSFFRLYELRFVEGTLPSMEEEEDWDREYYVVNRAALKELGYDSCQGATLMYEDDKMRAQNPEAHPIVAVIDDYYDGHISAGVHPMVFVVRRGSSGDLYTLSYRPGRLAAVMDYLKKVEREIYGTEEFEYTLFSDQVKQMYAADRRMAMLYTAFAFIAIVVSCLGLFGISLFDIRQRYREIAIRKVNGAMLKDLYVLLLRRYVGMLLLAAVVAVPLAWLAIHYYTADLVVKAPVTVGLFLAAFLIVAVISVATLLWQVNKASRINPSEVMKNE